MNTAPLTTDHEAETAAYERRVVRRGVDAMERFWSHVNVSGECWNWTAYIDGRGYGRFRPSPGVTVYAHRWLFEQMNGAIEDGHDVHHTCNNPICVNPAHLQKLTRQAHVDLTPVGRKKQSHCKRGHEMVGDNLYLRPDGQRACRSCSRENSRRQRTRQQAA